MSFFDKLIGFFPEVVSPTEKKISFKIKLKWTLIILVSFFILSRIPLAGLDPGAQSVFAEMAVILAASFVQARLLCNLFDGMVAIEGGKKTASGELFNDIPDRIADPLILVSAGYAVGFSWIGWLCAILAVMTAYVRILAAKAGAPQDFKGPMAKQHRMALMTIACLMSIFNKQILLIALIIIAIGSFWTVARRIISAYKYLEKNANN
jgi:phosphatidylglycerophosphate synthase